eukprot:jgi/Bigna1/58455/fgenesh1_pm.93_\
MATNAIVNRRGEGELIGKQVVIKGWVRTLRAQKQLAFMEINDGSSFSGIQVVIDAGKMEGGVDKFEDVTSKVTTGASVAVLGKLVESPGKGQAVEIQCEDIKIVGVVQDGDKYPLQKKRHSLEFLRSIAHLRARTNTFAAVSRVRSNKPAYLTVSGQLSGETYACAMGDIYTFGPTFRAENSQTSRHLAEFWMIEPEMAFADIFDAMDNCEGMVRAAATAAMEECSDDLEFFGKFYEKGLKERLGLIANKPFMKIEYKEAIKLLQEEITKDASKWEYPDVGFGTDLATEHERWICEKWGQGAATFVYNYPRDIKAFYMRDNDDGKTVAAFDLLVPGVGELAGGSQREERYDVLQKKLKEFDLIEDDYWWYMDLRKYGSVPHAGYGVGFERLVCYLTGMTNVRDVIPYPRYPGNAEF